MPGETTTDDLTLMRETLGQLGYVLLGEPTPIASGRNHNWRVETGAGPLFFRRHRHTRPRERIELGLAAMSHAATRGVPVAEPIAAADGSVLFGSEGCYASVYPWVEASTYSRGAITAAQAAVFGDIHGRLHVALRDFEHGEMQPATEVWWDSERSLRDLAHVTRVVRSSGPLEGLDADDVLGGIRRQVELLESGELPRPEEFGALPRQAIHGDVHEGNVMLQADGTVAAVVDWDMVATAPPLYEVLRAADFTYALDNLEVLDSYLASYAAAAPYEASLGERIVNLWTASVIHNTWALRAAFLEEDWRVAPFIGAHRQRIRQFSDGEYREWLAGRFAAFGE